MQLVVLAAGQGKRLGPLTAQRSKAMLPVVGMPMIGRVLEQLAGPHIHEIIIVAHPHDLELQRYFQSGQWQGRPLRLAFQEQRLGSADALRCAAPWLSGPFLLSACDNLVDQSHVAALLRAWEAEPRPNAVLSLLPAEPAQLSRSGVVRLEGEWVTYIVEKPGAAAAPSQIISLPLYIFPPQLLEFLPHTPLSPRGEYELQYAIQRLIETAGGVRGVMAQQRLTLTTPEDLRQINLAYLRKLDPHTLQIASPLPETATCLPPVLIEAEVQIGADCVIGPQVYLESGACVPAGLRLRRAVGLRGGLLLTEPAGDPMSESLPGRVDSLPNLD